jgi:hypothetical protein
MMIVQMAVVVRVGGDGIYYQEMYKELAVLEEGCTRRQQYLPVTIHNMNRFICLEDGIQKNREVVESSYLTFGDSVSKQTNGIYVLHFYLSQYHVIQHVR